MFTVIYNMTFNISRKLDFTPYVEANASDKAKDVWQLRSVNASKGTCFRKDIFL